MKEEDAKYLKWGLTATGVIAVGVLCFFTVSRFAKIAGAIDTLFAILAPFVYGAVIAYLLTPLCNRIERRFCIMLDRRGWMTGVGKKVASGAAIFLSVIAALLILWVLLLMILPEVCESVIGIVNNLPDQFDALNTWFHDFLEDEAQLQVYWDAISAEVTERLNNWMKADLLPTAQVLVTGVGSQIINVLAMFKNVLIGIIVSVYLLASRRKFAMQMKMLLHGVCTPKWAALIEEEVHYADEMFSGFLMGKLLDSAIIGVICFIVTSALSYESALLISVIVGVTNIIPFFGPFIGAIPCVILLFLEDPMHCLSFIVFIIILQQVDGNIIGPKILGNSTGLPGFWVLFSILLFGGLWGFIGMVIGVPLFAVIYDIVRRLVYFLLRHRGKEAMISGYDAAYGGKAGMQGGEEKKE